MMRLYKKVLLSIIFLFSIFLNGIAQNKDNIWTKVEHVASKSQKLLFRNSIPEKFENYNLDINKLKSELQNVSKRAVNLKISNKILRFPNDDGSFEKYEVFEASIMAPELQKEYPNIRSYVGKSVTNKGKTIRFSISNDGFHGMIFKKSGGTVYVDPYTSNTNSYIVYNKKSLPKTTAFECRFDEFNTSKVATAKNSFSPKTSNANDGNLRTFRLAIATTGEYAQFQLNNQGISASATVAEKKAAVLSAINTTLTRVNGIFERDVALTMVLVANETDIIYLDGTTDSFTNDDSTTLINESQTVIDNNIGSTNYDIGHTFSTGGGGLAQINSPCTNGKARGITGTSNPIGDAYDVDFVAHEMGHQYGAHHTFNGDAGSCSGNRNDATAVEPGSGSTIMAYSGICTPQNVQNLSDDYYHLVSIREMWANISVGSSTCGSITATGNNAPVVNALSNYSVPISTPFVLTADATDPDGDSLTYTWEQLDTEATLIPLSSTAIGGPAFRSVGPSSSPKRYFPNQSTVIAGNLANEWEVLPSVTRTMKFGVNVRDNNTAGGQTASQENTLSFVLNAGPFKVTSQNSSSTWAAGTSETITWDVANTDISPVNCSFVNIKLSIDGGFTYPTVLASNVPNNGNYSIVVPNVTTTTGRVIVESANNVFYAMNSTDIAIQASEFIMNFNSTENSICSPNNAVYNFTYNTFNGFNETTTFSASGNPVGTAVTFNPTTATADGTNVQMTISGITDANLGNSQVAVTGTSPSVTKTTSVNLNVFTSNLVAPVLNTPTNNEVGVLKPYFLSWNGDVNAESYDIEIATDNAFTNIVESSNIKTNSFNPQLLAINTLYYWRVRANNTCLQGSYSTVFNFTTANETCDSSNSMDTPLNIPDNDSNGITSVINFDKSKTITDVNVTVNITHTYDSDLALTLTSPQGTTIILCSGNGDGGDNFTNTIFDDSGTTSISLGSPPFTGIFKPLVDLSKFNNEASKGNWTLKVVDSGDLDTGTMDSWSIEICGVPLPDDDNDGIANSVDLCPNTTPGATVDDTGCFMLPQNNFDIQATSETCPDKNNGEIAITANETHDYVVTTTGTNTSFTDTQSFTNSHLFNNLAPDTYNVCISVPTESYEQCFVVEVMTGTTVSGKSAVKANKATVEIEQGTPPYKVYVNGNEILDTNNPVFTVDVKHGDLLEVKTAKTCEGVYSKSITLLNDFIVYPNPSLGVFDISMPISEKQVLISVYNIQAQLISQRSYNVNYGKVKLDIRNQPTGIYMVKLNLKEPVVLKIIKR